MSGLGYALQECVRQACLLGYDEVGSGMAGHGILQYGSGVVFCNMAVVWYSAIWHGVVFCDMAWYGIL